MDFTVDDRSDQFQLGERDIHVWQASLDCEETVVSQYETLLSEDEKIRAARFHFDTDRKRFIAARGILRKLLGAYLKTPGDQLRFDYARYGKPRLQGQSSSPLSFNLCHSKEVALYAIGRNRDIGIDIEVFRPDFASEDIAERYFSKRELEELRLLDPGLRDEGFFLCWTRKEAYLKAGGQGLQQPLNSFDVTVTPGNTAAFLRGVPPSWQLLDLSKHVKAAAALVYSGVPAHLSFRTIV